MNLNEEIRVILLKFEANKENFDLLYNKIASNLQIILETIEYNEINYKNDWFYKEIDDNQKLIDLMNVKYIKRIETFYNEIKSNSLEIFKIYDIYEKWYSYIENIIKNEQKSFIYIEELDKLDIFYTEIKNKKTKIINLFDNFNPYCKVKIKN